MTLLRPARARAYVNHGRWIAECPAECGSAVRLEPGQTLFHCSECSTISEVEWPEQADAIWEALLQRRLARTRNWFPVGHPLAVRAGCPQGQSPRELLDEQRENEDGMD
jgi:hypothetical protein